MSLMAATSSDYVDSKMPILMHSEEPNTTDSHHAKRRALSAGASSGYDIPKIIILSDSEESGTENGHCKKRRAPSAGTIDPPSTAPLSLPT